jgi:hypothetical protein
MKHDRIKVLYIAGAGRSGSTILGALLGQVGGCFFVGELGALFGGVAERLCGCGVRLEECELWRRVFAAGRQRLDLEEIYRRGRGSGARLLGARSFETFLEQLYRSIRTVTGSRVVVDSSKSVSYGRALSRLPGIELYVLHLVRDPRAVAFSWARRKPSPHTGGCFPSKPAGRSALEWVTYNAATELLLGEPRVRQRRLRYEDLVAHPGDTLEQLLGWIDESAAPLPAIAGGHVVLQVCHTVAGNADRFRTGEIELRCDDEWRRRMSWLARGGVGLVTWPLRGRYGY